MYKKFLFLLCLLWASPVMAQPVTCATRPLGDYTNACASTAFIGQMRAGNTNSLATTSGTLVNGHCVSIDASGNMVDAGGTCTIGGGGGTVTSGGPNQFAYYNILGNTVVGKSISQSWTTLQMGANVVNVLANGADPTGAADSSSAFQTALTAVGSTGGEIMVPCGKYLVTGDTLSISSLKGVTIQGGGADCTVIKTATGATPFTITLADISSSFHIRDLSITTGAVNTGNALAITQTLSSANPAAGSLNDITNVTIRGDDGVALSYSFSTAIAISSGVSNVYFTNVNVTGSGAVTGNGVTLIGDTVHSRYGVAYFFINCIFNFVQNGIAYGTYTQGVIFTNSSMTGVNYGIVASAGGTGLFQLTVTASQFNCSVMCIYLASVVNGVGISNNLFAISAASGYGVLGNLSLATIVGNVFTSSTATLTNAIITTNGTNGVQVTGNTFYNFQTGVNFQTGTTNANLQSNTYLGVTNKSVPASTSGTVVIGGGSQ